jgi:hypothetical protein
LTNSGVGVLTLSQESDAQLFAALLRTDRTAGEWISPPLEQAAPRLAEP